MTKLFRNLRITHSVAVIVLLAVLSTAFIGYSGLQGMNNINQNVERINEEAVIRTQVAMELSNQIMTARLEITRLAAYGYLPRMASEVEALNASTTELLAIYDQGIEPDSNQQILFDNIKRTHGDFINTWNTYAALLLEHEAVKRELRDLGAAEPTVAATAEPETPTEPGEPEAPTEPAEQEVAETEAVETEVTEEISELAQLMETHDQQAATLGQQAVSMESMGRSIVNNLATIMAENQEMAEQLYLESLAIHEANTRQMITVTLMAGALLFIISLLMIMIIRSSTKEISAIFNVVSQGDFTSDIEMNQRNEFGSIKNALAQTLQRVSATLNKTKSSMAQTDESAQSLAKICDDLSLATQEVANSIQEVATGSNSQADDLAAISQILTNFGQELEETVNVIEAIQSDAENTGDLVANGSHQLNDLVSSTDIIGRSFNTIGQQVQKLDHRLREIGDITNSINQISEQTNLLALNAAIEAARAGEAGRGFAVVAGEVRKLAEQSNQSASHINQLLEGIVVESQDIVKTTNENIEQLKQQEQVVNDAIASFKAILADITQLPPKIRQANESIGVINSSKDTILSRINQISTVAMEQSSIAQEIAAASEESSASVEEIASTAQVLHQMTREITQLLNQFVTKETGAEK